MKLFGPFGFFHSLWHRAYWPLADSLNRSPERMLERAAPRLIPLKLRDDEMNRTYPLPAPFNNMNAVYLLLGEVGSTRHYVVSDLRTGAICPGMIHLERFRQADEDEEL
jgi:hypothetical protein